MAEPKPKGSLVIVSRLTSAAQVHVQYKKKTQFSWVGPLFVRCMEHGDVLELYRYSSCTAVGACASLG
jgi:hypothetical protein